MRSSPLSPLFRSAAALLATGALCALTACGEAAETTDATGTTDTATPDSLVFAVSPGENSTAIAEYYGLVVEVLEEELGVPVELRNLTSYAALIEAQNAGQVDIATYGPLAYVSAVDSGVDVTAVATAAPGPEIGDIYRTHGLAAAGSGITDLTGFAGRTICFVDPTSTSGYLYPAAGLLEAGIDPEEDLTPVFVGGHDAAAISVAEGACDGGFVHDSLVETLLADGTLEDGDVEVVWESEDIASAPVAVRNDLGGELVDRIRGVFTTVLNQEALVDHGYCTGGEDCRLPQEAWGFIPVDDADFDGVRRVCALTGAQACAV